MKNKKLIFWIVLVFINLSIAGVIAAVYYYRTDSSPGVKLHRSVEKMKEGALKGDDIEGVGIWQTDDRFGYSHIPGSVGVHKTGDFKVKYTIGVGGERYIAAPKNPKGRVLFLGGSLTFGHGVEDSESFPALLAREYWSDFEVVNRAVMGWGTAHAYLSLLDELRSGRKPKMVIYGYIPDHVVRNYIRKDWIEVMERYKRKHPHFEIKDGELSFKGVVGLAGGLEDSAELGEKELKLTAAFLAAMKKLCQERDIPFVVIFLPKLQPLQAEVIKAIRDNRISSLDISRDRPEGFPGDPHPNAKDHRRIAESIGGSFITERIMGK